MAGRPPRGNLPLYQVGKSFQKTPASNIVLSVE